MKTKARSLFVPLCVTLALFIGVASAQELRRSGFFGVVAVPLTDDVRKQLPLNETGIIVQGLVGDGAAKAAGIQPGDVITQINDQKIADVDGFVQTARSFHAGDTVTFHFRHGTEILTKQVTVKPRPFESAPDVDTLYKTVTVDGTLRRVIVTAPKGDGKHPAILYVTGIGCFSQESTDLQGADAKLLYGLTRAGFVTMRVEKSGMGDSQGPPCSSPAVDLLAEQRGYVAGLKALKQYSFVDPDRVYIIGISIGGVQAPLIAQQVPVKGIVVINTVIKPFLEYLTDTRRRQNLLRHVPFDEMETRLRLNERCNHRLLIERQTADEILNDSPNCRDFITYPAAYTYMQQWAQLNLVAEWKKVVSPVLVVYGTSDYVSTIADDPYLADVINSFHPGSAALRSIPNMEHGMTKAPSMEASANKPAGTVNEFEPAILDAIKDWLRQRSDLSRSP
jgi:hypothetical protein